MKKNSSSGAKRRKYDSSFKEEVLQMIRNGRPVSEVARSLGIRENIIYRWKSRSISSVQQPATVDKKNSSPRCRRGSAFPSQTDQRTGDGA